MYIQKQQYQPAAYKAPTYKEAMHIHQRFSSLIIYVYFSISIQYHHGGYILHQYQYLAMLILVFFSLLRIHYHVTL